jgi:hypothetical protein
MCESSSKYHSACWRTLFSNDERTARVIFPLGKQRLKFISVKLLLKKANPDIEDALK